MKILTQNLCEVVEFNSKKITILLERFWLITDALMMNDLEDLKRVHNLANYLMVKRIKDNAKVAEA